MVWQCRRRHKAGVVLQVVAAGLPAVNIAYVNAESEPPEDAWPALENAFSMFLLGGHLQEDAPASHPPAEDVRPTLLLTKPRIGLSSHILLTGILLE